MEAYDDEESLAVAAAQILLSLKKRRLRRWPEWVPWPSEEEPAAAEAAVEAIPTLVACPKRRRSPPHARATPAVWLLMARNLGLLMDHGAGAGSGAGSGASSSGEDVAWSLPSARAEMRKVKAEHMAARRPAAPLECGAGAGSATYFGVKEVAPSPPRSREKPKVKVESMVARGPDAPRYYAAAAGSGPSTSGVDRARSRPRPRPRASEKAQEKTAAARKEAMAAPSPETPLDYAAAAGSGASSSGEDAARSPAKRKAPGAVGSGGASSGNEGCSSPSKRPHLAGAVKGKGVAVKVEEAKIKDNPSTDYRDENGVLLFDLNEGLNQWED